MKILRELPATPMPSLGALIGVAGLLYVLATAGVGSEARAEDISCRQSWMPLDAPTFCPWRVEPSLSEARSYAAVVGSGEQVYVLGGYRYDAATGQVIYYDTVARSSVGSDGRLSAWSTEPKFAKARSGAAAVVAGDCLILSGGSSSTESGTTYYDDVQSSRIMADQHLSTWRESPHRLKTARSNHSLVAVKTDQGTFLKAVAGVTQVDADTVHLDTIETAKLEADCSVGEWSLDHFHLKGGRSSPQALLVGSSLLVIGGWGDLDLIDIYDDVQVTVPRSDGTSSPWRTSSSPLATGIYGHATVAAPFPDASGRTLLLSVGGQPGAGAYANWISFAYAPQAFPIADGISRWRIAPTGRMPTARAGLSAIVVGDRLYVIGGSDANGNFLSDAISTQFTFGQP